jgi:hypothetical protein
MAPGRTGRAPGAVYCSVADGSRTWGRPLDGPVDELDEET